MNTRNSQINKLLLGKYLRIIMSSRGVYDDIDISKIGDGSPKIFRPSLTIQERLLKAIQLLREEE